MRVYLDFVWTAYLLMMLQLCCNGLADSVRFDLNPITRAVQEGGQEASTSATPWPTASSPGGFGPSSLSR